MTGPGRATSLVGRDRELRALAGAIAAAGTGHGQVVLIEGEAGIGKTRLVEAACEHAHSAGFDTFVGACDDLVAPRPFAALVDAFGIGGDPERTEIADLLEIHRAPDTAALAGTANPGLQYRVTEALGALVERLAARAPLLLALDDSLGIDGQTLVAAS